MKTFAELPTDLPLELTLQRLTADELANLQHWLVESEWLPILGYEGFEDFHLRLPQYEWQAGKGYQMQSLHSAPDQLIPLRGDLTVREALRLMEMLHHSMPPQAAQSPVEDAA